jgi:hypothetical protein
MDKMNSQIKTEPIRVVTSWRRFSCGLWRVREGDISAAYSADTMPRVKVFTHESRLYTNGGGHSKWLHAEVNAYPLIHADEYQGPDSAPYSYEGKTVTHKGKTYRLGPKTLFAASDPTIDEWRHLCRVLYADGGYFASGCTYSEFLSNRFDPESVNGREARFKELAECGAKPTPRTQGEMCRLLESGTSSASQPQQIDFKL